MASAMNDGFTLEAQKNHLTKYGDPEPIALKDVTAIWEHQSPNANQSSYKILDKQGQECKLTKNGQNEIAQAKDFIKDTFIPARSVKDDSPLMVNPSNISSAIDKATVDEDGTSIISLPNKTEIYLVDDLYGFGLDTAEAAKAVGVQIPTK